MLIAPALRLTSSFVQECLGSQALERCVLFVCARVRVVREFVQCVHVCVFCAVCACMCVVCM